MPDEPFFPPDLSRPPTEPAPTDETTGESAQQASAAQPTTAAWSEATTWSDPSTRFRSTPAPSPFESTPAPGPPVQPTPAAVGAVSAPEPRRRTGRAVLVGLAALTALAVLGGAAIAARSLTGTGESASPEPAASAPVDQPAGALAPIPASPASSPPAGRPDAAGQSASRQPPSASAPAPAAAPVAVEEFAGTAPDTTRWGLYASTAQNGSTQLKSNVRVAAGELQIVGTGKDPSGKGNTTGGVCWCGVGGNQTYGKWELRARFDAGRGYGPIIGLWPQSDKGTDGSFAFATRTPDRRTAAGYVLWAGGGHDERSLAGDYTAWHTYTLEWRATFVRILVDGAVLYDSTTAATKVPIPTVPMHIYLQQIAGPNIGVPAPDASTPAQVTMHVDWVRIYR